MTGAIDCPTDFTIDRSAEGASEPVPAAPRGHRLQFELKQA